MSKYILGVNFNFSRSQTSVEITRSEFNELLDILQKISNDKFEFRYTKQSLQPDNMNIIPDPELPPVGKVWSVSLSPAAERATRLQMLEIKIERILNQAEDLKSEIKCIRKGD